MKTEIFRLLAAALFWLPAAGRAVEPQILTVAVFDFEAKDDPAHDLGSQVASLLNAQLSARTELMTVERAELAKVLGEHELGLSGTVSTETAAKLGHLTGRH